MVHPAQGAGTQQPLSWRSKPWCIAGAITVCLIYIAIYFVTAVYNTELEVTRLQPLLYLIIPDALVQLWVGGSWSRFGVLDRLPILATTGLILFVSFLLGRLLLQALRVDRQSSRLENTLFAIASGLNFLSVFTLACGLFGDLRSPLPFLLLATGGLAGFAFLRWRAGSFFATVNWLPTPPDSSSTGPTEPLELSRRVRLTLFFGCLIITLCITLGSMLPPWHFDVREYHSQVPKEWFQQGQVSFMPHNVYGNMPQGAAMHAVPGMALLGDWWHGALVGKTVIASCAGLTAAMLFSMGCRFFSPSVGIISAFIYLCTPWPAYVSTAGMIDGVLAFYSLATFYAFLLSTRQRDALGYVFIAGWMAGAAVACKYPALLFIVMPLLAAMAVYEIQRVRQAASQSTGDTTLPRQISQRLPHMATRFLVATVAIVLACGLWFGKNAVLTGNPTYPLLYEVFGGETRTPENAAQWQRAHRTPGGGLSFAGLSHSLTKISVKSAYQGVLLVPLAILGLISAWRKPHVLLLFAIICFGLATWWLLTHRLDRFLLPFLPFTALLAGLGACFTYRIAWHRFLIVFLGLGFITGVTCITSRSCGDTRYLVALADLREDEVLDVDPDYSHMNEAHRYINHEVPRNNRVMLVGEAQVFPIDRDILYNTCFDDCVMEQMFAGKTRDERLAALRAAKISHIYIFWRELERYRAPGNYGYSDYVTRDLVERELMAEQQLLRPIPLPLDPKKGQLFEVQGWQNW